jgi:hypothetical protein
MNMLTSGQPRPRISSAAVGNMFHSIVSLQGKLSALDTVAAASRISPEARTEWKRIKDKVEKVAKERNTIIHGIWGTSTNHPDAIILVPAFWSKFEVKNAYTQKDLTAILERITDLDQKLWDFLKHT